MGAFAYLSPIGNELSIRHQVFQRLYAWIRTSHIYDRRINQTLKMTPAMAAGITNRLWEIEDLLALPG
jgi:hypothetical protein